MSRPPKPHSDKCMLTFAESVQVLLYLRRCNLISLLTNLDRIRIKLIIESVNSNNTSPNFTYEVFLYRGADLQLWFDGPPINMAPASTLCGGVGSSVSGVQL